MKVKLPKKAKAPSKPQWQDYVQEALDDAAACRERLEKFLSTKRVMETIEEYQTLQREVSDAEAQATARMRDNSEEFSKRGRGVFDYKFEGYSISVTNPVEYDVDGLLAAHPKLEALAKIKKSITAPEIDRLITTGVLKEADAKKYASTGTPRISLKVATTTFEGDE